jgi:hypothetical protein
MPPVTVLFEIVMPVFVGAVVPLAVIVPEFVTVPTVVLLMSMQVMIPVFVGLVWQGAAQAEGIPAAIKNVTSELDVRRPSLRRPDI